MLANVGWIIHPEDLTRDLIDRLASAGVNELGIHPGGGKAAGALLDQTLVFHTRQQTRALYAYAADRGLSVEYDAHVLMRLLPREEFAAHPDWFRMDERGERNPDMNMCASNPEALERVSDSAYELCGRLRTPSHRYAYWPDDVRGGACHCPKCRLLSKSDQALRITNAIARGLRKRDKQALIGYLAYMDTLEPPRLSAPEEGVYLEFAPIDRDSHRPIDDPHCPENARQIRHIRELLDFFGVQNARILEYWVDNSRFSDWKRPPKPFALDADTMRRDVEYYYSLGFRDMTSFACFLGEDYISLYGQPPIEAYADILKRTGEHEAV